MTIFRIHLGLLVEPSKNWFLHTQEPPLWSTVLRHLRKQIVQIDAKMHEDRRTDYQELAERRATLREFAAVCPRRGVVEQSVLANADVNVNVVPIEVVR